MLSICIMGHLELNGFKKYLRNSCEVVHFSLSCRPRIVNFINEWTPSQKFYQYIPRISRVKLFQIALSWVACKHFSILMDFADNNCFFDVTFDEFGVSLEFITFGMRRVTCYNINPIFVFGLLEYIDIFPSS